jgi:hypothetical protein
MGRRDGFDYISISSWLELLRANYSPDTFGANDLDASPRHVIFLAPSA